MDKSLPFSFSNMELRNPQLALKPSSPLVKAKVSLKGWGELAKGGEDTTSCSPPAPLAHGSPLYHLPWPLPNPTLSSSLLLILYSQSLPYPELQSISLLWYLQMAKKLNKVMAWLALWVSSVCLMLFNRCLGGGDVISGAPGGLPLPPIRTVDHRDMLIPTEGLPQTQYSHLMRAHSVEFLFFLYWRWEGHLKRKCHIGSFRAFMPDLTYGYWSDRYIMPSLAILTFIRGVLQPLFPKFRQTDHSICLRWN